jgi:TRAP-type C4-dicarboxylate transport system permease small subunit
MNALEKIGIPLSKSFYWIAGAAILAMMGLTCGDVVLRYLRMPIPGTYELVCFMGAVAVSFAMAHTSVQQGHVAVSLLLRLFPKRVQGVVEAVTGSLSFILFALLAWRSFLYADTIRTTGEVSLTLKMPFYPFIFGVGVSAGVVCLVLLSDLMKNLKRVFRR